MDRVLKVARREYVETIKTKTFVLSVLMTPVLIGGIIFFTGRLTSEAAGPRPPRKVAVTDLSGKLAGDIKSAFDKYNRSEAGRQILLEEVVAGEGDAEAAAARQKERVRRGELDAYVVLDKEAVDGAGWMHVYTLGASGGKIAVMDFVSTVQNLLNGAVVNQRCALRNVSPELLEELRREMPTEQLAVDAGPTSQETPVDPTGQVIRMMVPFFFLFLMFMGIFGTGQQILSSVLEEKSSRVMEILLSAVSPFELMAGKILGLTGIGLTVTGLWGAAGYGVARWRGLPIEVESDLLVWYVAYFLLGFVLFSAILAGMGSICNTLKEAQSLLMPVSLVLVVPMMAWFYIVQNPDGAFSRVLSFLPPVSPMVMILRICASPHLSRIEIGASLVVLAVSVPVVTWAAAKVFRTGILMTGKRPQLREVLRWLGQS